MFWICSFILILLLFFKHNFLNSLFVDFPKVETFLQKNGIKMHILDLDFYLNFIIYIYFLIVQKCIKGAQFNFILLKSLIYFITNEIFYFF